MKPIYLTPKQMWKSAYSHARLMLQGISGDDLFEDFRLRNVIHTKPQNQLMRKSMMIIALQYVAREKCRDSIYFTPTIVPEGFGTKQLAYEERKIKQRIERERDYIEFFGDLFIGDKK